MRELSLAEIREFQISILDYVVEICKSNSLCFSLDSGTLIGAIRHKGYIPWDDDIDITMLRKDYNKLIDILKEKDGRYKVFCFEVSDDYYYPFAKIVDTKTLLIENKNISIPRLGINIDIFPQDNLPDDEEECRKFQQAVRKTRDKIMFAVMKTNIKELFVHPRFVFKSVFYSIVGWKHEMRKLEKYVQKYADIETQWVEQIVSTSAMYRKGPRRFFDEFIEAEFEGKKYPVIKEYDAYLRNIYGDYMQLPPEEKRVTHHDFIAYLYE